MKDPLLEQLQSLSDKIDKEEARYAIDLFLDSEPGISETVQESLNLRERTKQKESAVLSLTILRIHTYLKLIQKGYSSYEKDLKEDWSEIVTYAKRLEGVWHASDTLLNVAIELTLLPDPQIRNELLRQLGFHSRLRIKKQQTISFDALLFALEMAAYYLLHGMSEEGYAVTKNTALLSQARSNPHSGEHRTVVKRALWYLVDINPSLAAEIGDRQRTYFEGVADNNAIYFYWFYAWAICHKRRVEESLPYFQHCYDLCMKLEGETSWIGAQAGLICQYSQIESGDAAAAEAYMWDVLQKMDEGFYPDMDDRADFVGAYTRSVLLKYHMDNQDMRGLLPTIERFREYCLSVENTNINPRLTVRYAENILAEYYLEIGSYLQSADHITTALNSIPPEGTDPIPSDEILYTNLLLINIIMNNREQMSRLIDIVTNLTRNSTDNYLLSRVTTLVSTAQRRLGEEVEDLDDKRRQLLDIHWKIRTGRFKLSSSATENVSTAQRIINTVSECTESGASTRRDLIRFQGILKYFLKRSQVFFFSEIQKGVCCSALTLIQWLLDSPELMATMEKSLECCESVIPMNEARISIQRSCAVIYYNLGQKNMSDRLISQVLSGITAAWQKATSYLDDHKICQLMSFIQDNFRICYAIMRADSGSKQLYDTLLRFKDLPALVGRERNRLLQQIPADSELCSEIYALQDRLATAQMQDSLCGTNSAQKIAQQLQHLEAAFAARFPDNLCFTNISFNGVCWSMPDDSAILEYCFAYGEESLRDGLIYEDQMELDLFVTVKRNGITQLHHIRIPQGFEILQQTLRFIEILQDQQDISRNKDKISLREDLYRSLISPALPFLEGITILYIAPDGQLCNLPFEILHTGRGPLLQDSYNICRLSCGRDLLFYTDTAPTGGSFVLGDPDYEAEIGERSDSLSRKAGITLDTVQPLPFSGVEAQRICRWLQSDAYTGKSATKYALQKALPCKVIHLATHGVFDEEMSGDSLYSSHLVFAGYNNWVTKKQESTHCGNGVLTADEISRMDLKRTELVVLSACQSGMGDTSMGSTQGLISAFSAAGVRWIISHLWSADDFSTPILMDAFYYAHLKRHMDVPEALRYAKNYLRTVTAGELKRNGWLRIPNDPRIHASVKSNIESIANSPERWKPFADEHFWGGFVVHKSR